MVAPAVDLAGADSATKGTANSRFEMTEISERSPVAADDELRLIRILQHRGRLVTRAFDEASPIQRLVEAGLVRAVERPGADVILVLSGDGLRLAQRPH
jgi:hypothetical protein